MSKRGSEVHNTDLPLGQLSIWPPKPDELTDPKSRTEEEGPNRPCTVPLHQHQKLPSLLRAPVFRD
jgi:hypothetical protein